MGWEYILEGAWLFMKTQACFPELHKPRVVVLPCNISMQEEEARRPEVQGHTYLCWDFKVFWDRDPVSKSVVFSLYNFCNLSCWFLFYFAVILKDTNSHLICFVLSRLDLWPKMWFILEKAHWALEKTTDSTAVGWNSFNVTAIWRGLTLKLILTFV